jgi:hypothetical protein
MAPKYPAIPDPTSDVNSLRDAVLALKQAVELLTGQRGDDSTTAVTGSAGGSAGSQTPKMDDIAAVGSSTNWSREDHVHPSDTSRLAVAGGQTVTGGFSITPGNLGNVTGGSGTLSSGSGNYQYYTNNGAHTLNAPASDCAIDILITNGATAGAITLSGFTVNSNIGEPFTTTNGHKFVLSVRRINGVSTYLIKALQ